MNPPLVESIKLQGRAMAGFLAYPRKVALMFADEGRTLYEWFVSVDKVGWRLCLYGTRQYLTSNSECTEHLISGKRRRYGGR